MIYDRVSDHRHFMKHLKRIGMNSIVNFVGDSVNEVQIAFNDRGDQVANIYRRGGNFVSIGIPKKYVYKEQTWKE